MMSPECETALQQLDALRRGELDTAELLSLRDHLEACRRCFSFKKHEEAFLDRLLAATRNSTCPEELRSTIYQMIAKESRDN